MSEAIEALLSQLRDAARTADLSARFRLSGQLQRLARSIATPRQTMQDYGYMYTELVMARIAADLDIFAILTDSESPMKTEEVAGKCGGDPALIARVLRHLASTYTISETGPSTYAANDTTRILATPAGKGNIMFGFNVLDKAFIALPDFLKESGFKSPDQTLDTAFHKGTDTKEQFFIWMQRDPEIIRHFHPSLTAFVSPVSWTAKVPLTNFLKDTDDTTALFVDIGGGHGAQCSAFRKAIENKALGRVINQDLPPTLAEAPKQDGIEMMAQDFYKEQQIKGARIYYIRQCLHDLPDAIAKQVLVNVRDAMSPTSVLLIDELVLPETGASRFSQQLDVTMMAMFNSTERTVPHWRSLLAEAGLQLGQIYRYDPDLEYSVLEARLSNNEAGSGS